MVIILKIICFGVWLMIMLVLLAGGQSSNRNLYKKVRLILDDDDDPEMRIRQVLGNLKPEERLEILDRCSKKDRSRRCVVCIFLRKNPSIIYGQIEENFA